MVLVFPLQLPDRRSRTMYCGAGHRIFVFQITDCPSTFLTLRADVGDREQHGPRAPYFKCCSTLIATGLPLVCLLWMTENRSLMLCRCLRMGCIDEAMFYEWLCYVHAPVNSTLFIDMRLQGNRQLPRDIATHNFDRKCPTVDSRRSCPI